MNWHSRYFICVPVRFHSHWVVLMQPNFFLNSDKAKNFWSLKTKQNSKNTIYEHSLEVNITIMVAQN